MRHDGPARVEIISILDERQSASITIQQNAHDVAGPVVRAIQSFGPEGLRRPIIDKANARPAAAAPGAWRRRGRGPRRRPPRPQTRTHVARSTATSQQWRPVPRTTPARGRGRPAAPCRSPSAGPRLPSGPRRTPRSSKWRVPRGRPVARTGGASAAGARPAFFRAARVPVGVLPRFAHAPPPPRLARRGRPAPPRRATARLTI